MKEIKHPELLKAILNVEERGAIETAHRILAECNNLWLYALQHGYVENNIIANIIKLRMMTNRSTYEVYSVTIF
jgi:hypothetical protein